MMSARLRTRGRFAAAVMLTFCSFGLEQQTSAESTDDCMKVKGKLMVEFSGGRTIGTITNAGILNGSAEIVFDPAAFPTPDPTTVSFTGALTVTTRRGILKTHDVYLGDGANGLGTGIHRIDPNASTGIFAGATGVLYDNSKIGPSGAEGGVTGAICFADK